MCKALAMKAENTEMREREKNQLEGFHYFLNK